MKKFQSVARYHFKLVYKDGRSQDYNISSLMEVKGKIDTTLAPRKKASGELGYEVAKKT